MPKRKKVIAVQKPDGSWTGKTADKEWQAERGNYVPKLSKLHDSVPLDGKFHESVIYHDDWCDFLNGRGKCNCDPEVKLLY
jgi:hypothetical protein